MLSSHPTPWRNDSHKNQQRLRNPLEPNHIAPKLLPQQLVMREQHSITATTITATATSNTGPMDQVHGHTSTDSTRYHHHHHHHPSYDDDHHYPFHSSQPEVRSENHFVVLFEHVGAHFLFCFGCSGSLLSKHTYSHHKHK